MSSQRALKQLRATLQRLPLPRDDKFVDLLDELAARENNCARRTIAAHHPAFIRTDASS